MKKIKNFVKLMLLKIKSYKLKKKPFCTTNLIYNLKFNLKMVHNYHIKGKTIFFIGFPNKLPHFKKTIKTTKHIFIPENIWLYGALSNQKRIGEYIKGLKNEKLKILLEMKKKPNLIVLSYKNEAILKEIKNLRVPIISIYSLNDIVDTPFLRMLNKEEEEYLTSQYIRLFFLSTLHIFKKNKQYNKHTFKKKY